MTNLTLRAVKGSPLTNTEVDNNFSNLNNFKVEKDSSGDVVITGDLTVNGTTTTINSTTLSVNDKNIVLADSAGDAAAADGAGITINGASATLTYASSGDKWNFNKPLDMGSNQITTTGKILFANVYSAEGDLPSASTYHGMFAHVHGTGKGYFAHAGNWLKLVNHETSGDVDLGSNKILFANVYSNESDLPSASTYHGMFAHVHATGHGYFAHGGNWIKLANLSGATFTGDVSAPNFNSTSDSQLKDNIKQINSALDKVDSIRGVTFNWKDSGKASMGVIAQEVEEIAPEVVSEVDGYKAVNYDGLIGLLIESIKELKQEIQDLKSK